MHTHRQSATEEAFRKLDGDLTSLRSQLLALEGALRAQVRAVDRLEMGWHGRMTAMPGLHRPCRHRRLLPSMMKSERLTPHLHGGSCHSSGARQRQAGQGAGSRKDH